MGNEHLGFYNFGNGTVVAARDEIDSATKDYRKIAHISEEGVIKYYTGNVSDEDRKSIKEAAKGSQERFRGKWESLPLDLRYDTLLGRCNATQLMDILSSGMSMDEAIDKYFNEVIMEQPSQIKEYMYISDSIKGHEMDDGDIAVYANIVPYESLFERLSSHGLERDEESDNKITVFAYVTTNKDNETIETDLIAIPDKRGSLINFRYADNILDENELSIFQSIVKNVIESQLYIPNIIYKNMDPIKLDSENVKEVLFESVMDKYSNAANALAAGRKEELSGFRALWEIVEKAGLVDEYRKYKENFRACIEEEKKFCEAGPENSFSNLVSEAKKIISEQNANQEKVHKHKREVQL